GIAVGSRGGTDRLPPQTSLPCGGSVDESTGAIPCASFREKSKWQAGRVAQITTPFAELQSYRSPGPVTHLSPKMVADVIYETVPAVGEAGHDVPLSVRERPRHRASVLWPDDGVGGADEEARPPPRPDAVDVAHRVGGAEIGVVAAQGVEDGRELRRRRQPGGVEQRRHPAQEAHRGGRQNRRQDRG